MVVATVCRIASPWEGGSLAKQGGVEKTSKIVKRDMVKDMVFSEYN
jgi:hypothetical protein